MKNPDWSQLKRAYITGSIVSVRAFLKSQGIKANGNVVKKVTGWRD